MARRCSREQVAQNTRRRPFSTAVVQVSGRPSTGRSAGATAPQKSQVGALSLTRSRLRDAADGGPDPGQPGQRAGPRQPVAAGVRSCWSVRA